MAYVGLQQQIKSNNTKSIVLLLAFPLLVLIMVFILMLVLNYNPDIPGSFDVAINEFLKAIPITFLVVGIWFAIAYFGNSAMINATAGSHSVSRKENMRIYNLTENLCMSVGMTMPKLRIIESQALNAFASGINEKSYTVTLTTGIIDTLTDEELEGVIAHELTHIRNNDVRLLIISVIFVGIFSFVMQVAMRSLYFNGAMGGRRRNNNDKGGGALIIIVIIVLAAVAYFLSFLFKLALSRRREYLADSGAVEMTHNAEGLASALEKISGNSRVEEVKSEDVRQMFIENKPKLSSNFLGGLSGIFATHPPIEKRIKFLRQL